ncbi:hypothetical protein TVAG_264170 [Trichomonas vaginalis G3]|uniref:E2F/DP family winged-helix DNA-binding domain-containing protein n=1 Tax=Trichomonas vaginalis (strain ATCC PRA-98 / G3) TaxID=412133 RepID=A2FFL4_TRIV3|nr:transcription factor DP family [Trichomonas vaginalis G3]EAX96293.1 hypothetical protein TVAG_264170 [Trichomonas vaginalis G3]KAI5491272.1 transcription factor DP family [Trichomonas vaginalis G3]|eukprot:XP_001309223.1 hypothetical protein [Trichomonas vaginalis G3]
MTENKDKVCLKALAPRLLELLLELGETTSESIATILINNLIQENPHSFSQETVRRRIYDVINVLSATGIIEKDGKKLNWRGLKRQNPGAEAEQAPKPNAPSPLVLKQRSLFLKLRILAAYKALIQKNFPNRKPPNALPARVMVFGTASNEIKTTRLGRHEIKIELRERPTHFFSPTDIILHVQFPPQLIHDLLEINPLFAKYSKEVIDHMLESQQNGMPV